MLSINIPVYNIEVGNLVLQLINQAKNLGISYEIRVYDDCSDFDYKKRNRIISKYSNVIYLELEKNLGRSAIRNKMGIDSKFDYLLFIDADSKIVKDDYLEMFLNNIKPNRVLCGGTAYQKEKPIESEKLLRWVYGINREAVSAEIRNSKKGFIITSNNFLIEKKLFQKIHFREEINKYGHEDTLLGYDLFMGGIEIFHIDNPVEHTGLESSEQFVEKTKMALKSLYQITNELLKNENIFVEQVHFLNKYSQITKYIPAMVFRLFYKNCHSIIERNLSGKNPRLFWFDIYKLGFYSTLK
ncbi:MAG: glycosyltransferase [Draconibacterium sp.]|nr:glycosyltransferase [Draconibacterium sp.]